MLDGRAIRPSTRPSTKMWPSNLSGAPAPSGDVCLVPADHNGVRVEDALPFMAHRAILRKFPFFQRMLATSMPKDDVSGQDGCPAVPELAILGVTSQALRGIVKYIYSESTSEATMGLGADELTELAAAADICGMPELLRTCSGSAATPLVKPESGAAPPPVLRCQSSPPPNQTSVWYAAVRAETESVAPAVLHRECQPRPPPPTSQECARYAPRMPLRSSDVQSVTPRTCATEQGVVTHIRCLSPVRLQMFESADEGRKRRADPVWPDCIHRDMTSSGQSMSRDGFSDATLVRMQSASVDSLRCSPHAHGLIVRLQSDGRDVNWPKSHRRGCIIKQVSSSLSGQSIGIIRSCAPPASPVMSSPREYTSPLRSARSDVVLGS